MAKQLGVSDAALKGLNDLESFPFPPDEKAALRFADAMTRGGQVDDGLFETLRAHFTEPQMIEIASVVGLFNYFNRFNNAFRMDITLVDPDVLAVRVSALIAERDDDPRTACERVVALLKEGRRYESVAILAKEGTRLVPLAGRGGETDHFAVSVPIQREGQAAGVIEVKTGRGHPDAEDSALLERIAGLLFPLLASRPSAG